MEKTYPKRPNYPEETYVDYDDDTGLWCVFGLDSGHAYSSHASEEAALDSLKN